MRLRTVTRLRTGPIKNATYPTKHFYTRKRCVGFSMEQQNFTTPRWLSPCLLALICSNTLLMYFFSSNNSHMSSSLPTSRNDSTGRIIPSDQTSLRFLWRVDLITKVVVYRYKRHILGAKDSPTCANNALQRTVRDNDKFYPDAARPVLVIFTWQIILSQEVSWESLQ